MCIYPEIFPEDGSQGLEEMVASFIQHKNALGLDMGARVGVSRVLLSP